MPEFPDFEKIARSIIGLRDFTTDGLTAQVAEQLRQVWNARGAADLKVVIDEGHYSEADGRDAWEEMTSAIKALDR